MLPYLYVWCILLKQSHHIPFVCILDGYWGNFRYIWHFEGWRRRYVFVVILTAVYVVGVIVVVVQLHCHFTIWLFWLKKYFIWFSTVPVSHVLHQWLHLMKDYSAHSNVTNNFHAKIFYVLGRGERGGKNCHAFCLMFLRACGCVYWPAFVICEWFAPRLGRAMLRLSCCIDSLQYLEGLTSDLGMEVLAAVAVFSVAH